MSLPADNNNELSFWDHIESLRWTIIRILFVLMVFVVLVFGYKELVFNKYIFAPLDSNFAFYQVLCKMGMWLGMPAFCTEAFKIELINVQLSGQFMAHLSASITLSLLLTVPYLLFEVWKFVRPALYENERKHIGMVFFFSSFLFYLGVLVSYFLIFPLTIRFLGTYQVSDLVPNQISLDSYMGTLFLLTFTLGLMFEMPVLAYFLSKLGLITRQTLRSGRSIAVVVLLVVSAIITPTTDPFTMLFVAIPLYVLFEFSILVCRSASVDE